MRGLCAGRLAWDNGIGFTRTAVWRANASPGGIRAVEPGGNVEPWRRAAACHFAIFCAETVSVARFVKIKRSGTALRAVLPSVRPSFSACRFVRGLGGPLWCSAGSRDCSCGRFSTATMGRVVCVRTIIFPYLSCRCWTPRLLRVSLPAAPPFLCCMPTTARPTAFLRFCRAV